MWQAPQVGLIFGAAAAISSGVLASTTACAAALAALGYWQPSIPEVRHMKSIARGFPSWFFEAFAAILVEHA